MTIKPRLALALLLAAIVAHATELVLPPDTCGAKDPHQVQSQVVYCGDDAACIARETAMLPEAMRALDCEAQRLSPANVLTAPAPAQGHM